MKAERERDGKKENWQELFLFNKTCVKKVCRLAMNLILTQSSYVAARRIAG